MEIFSELKIYQNEWKNKLNQYFEWVDLKHEKNKKNASLSLLFYFDQIIGYVPQVLILLWVRIIMIKRYKDERRKNWVIKIIKG